jgi:hypothetical protein
MRCQSIALVLAAAAAFTPKTSRGGLGLSTTKPAALLRSTATLQEEAVIVYPPDDKMPPKLDLKEPIRETHTERVLRDANDMLASLSGPGQPTSAESFVSQQSRRPTRSNTPSDALFGAHLITGPPRADLRGPDSSGTEYYRITTDEGIDAFEDKAFAADDYGGVLTDLRVGATDWDTAWALDHHLGVVSYHSDGRKRALVLPPIERIVAHVHRKLKRGQPLEGRLEEATKDWLELVCVSATSLKLKTPFDTLADGYDYCPDGDGGYMAISAPAALLYSTNQWMACRGHLPEFIQEAAACFFAEHSLFFRAEVGMGNPLALGDESELRLVNWRAKDSWAELMAAGLETGFKGYLVMGMCGPHYRRWAHDHGLPEAVVVDLRTLGPDDFSLAMGATRSEAFQKIFDTCLAHGVLGPGDELLLVKALGLVRDGKSDLIEALEILNVVAVGDGTFEMRGSERVAIKVKSWPADLPIAEELRNALAPSSMGVAAFLGACKFVPVPDSAQIKSRHRRVDATHWSICAQVPPEAYGDVVDVGQGKRGYRPGRFLDPTKSFLVTQANDPARGLLDCHGCRKKQLPKKWKFWDGTKGYVCSICCLNDYTMITEPTGKYANNSL